MKNIYNFLAILILILTSRCQNPSEQDVFGLAIHGGAGTISKGAMTSEMETAYRRVLDSVITLGYQWLSDGKTALEVVEACVVLLEDHPLFNAGRGAVFNHDGIHELDASIMNGANLEAGAVGSLKRIKNPIKAARAVLEHSEHVFLVGEGAESFAANHGIEFVDQDYFFTESRWKALQKVKEAENIKISTDAQDKHGTVGCVALDKQGNLAAATSTGGMTNKKYGRVGDSPIIGSGTYADNRTCAISCTGHGEYFMRLNIAYNIHAQMLYGNKSLMDAANHAIHKELSHLGGDGGIIGIDTRGQVVMIFNSEGMYRAKANAKGKKIAIFGDEL